MNRRFFKSLTLWIVPLLIARAMIPAGLMLSVDADGLALMFCSGSVSHPVAAGQAAQHDGHAGHHDASQHSGHAQHQGHENSPCPFSLAASVAPTDVECCASTAILSADAIFEFLSAPTFSVGPPRTDHIRGPPSLA
jgi:hypothetical protein